MLGKASPTRSSSGSNRTRHSRSPKRKKVSSSSSHSTKKRKSLPSHAMLPEPVPQRTKEKHGPHMSSLGIKTEQAPSDEQKLRRELAESNTKLASINSVSHCSSAEHEHLRQELSQRETALLQAQQKLEQSLDRALQSEQQLGEELRGEKMVNTELKSEVETFRSTRSSSQPRDEHAELGSELRSRDSRPEDYKELAWSSREALMSLRNTEEQQDKERRSAEERLQQSEQRYKNEQAVLKKAYASECTDDARHARVAGLQEAMQLASSLREQECEGERLSEQLAESQDEAERSQQILQESRLERQAYEEESQQRMQMYVAMEQRELRNELRNESRQLETQQELHQEADQDCQNRSEEVMQLLDECHGFKVNGRTEQATLRRLEKDNERLKKIGRDESEQEAFRELQQEMEEMSQRQQETEKMSQEHWQELKDMSQELKDMSQEHLQEQRELSEEHSQTQKTEANLRDALAAQRSAFDATSNQKTAEAAEVAKIKERMRAERHKATAHKAEMKKAERTLGIYKAHNEALSASLDKEREARDRAQRKCILSDEELSQKNEEVMQVRAEAAEQNIEITTLKGKMKTLELDETLPATQQRIA